jgi:hypothetical protein
LNIFAHLFGRETEGTNLGGQGRGRAYFATNGAHNHCIWRRRKQSVKLSNETLFYSENDNSPILTSSLGGGPMVFIDDVLAFEDADDDDPWNVL